MNGFFRFSVGRFVVIHKRIMADWEKAVHGGCFHSFRAHHGRPLFLRCSSNSGAFLVRNLPALDERMRGRRNPHPRFFQDVR